MLTRRLLFRKEILHPDEIAVITKPKEKLHTGHINAAQTLLRQQFKNIGGLMCASYSELANYPAFTKKKSLQILHCPDHWVLVSLGFLESDCVQVYDTLTFQKSSRQLVLACMSSLVRTEEAKMPYEIVACQRQQSGSNDCGVLAIAFATNLAHGQDPSTQIFDSKECRLHLQNAFKNGLLDIFPSRERRFVNRKNVKSHENVHCVCRRIDYVEARLAAESRMWFVIECSTCKEWFHEMCVGYPVVAEDEDWYCPKHQSQR